jgi:RNA polymerase sigma-70 factor, ECF subfamily
MYCGNRMVEASTELFVRLLLTHEQDMYFYAFSLVANLDDAKDVVQEAAVTMWKQFNEFDASRPFMPWASRFIYFSALTFMRHRRRGGLLLTEEAMEAIADDAVEYASSTMQPRLKALSECLEKLPAPSRRLMEDRYQQGQSIKNIAKVRRLNLHTLYKAFDKIHGALQTCIERTLALEELA